jgi:hypothetical protein
MFAPQHSKIHICVSNTRNMLLELPINMSFEFLRPILYLVQLET